MKNNQNKNSKSKANDVKKNTLKKASYIGAALLSLAGLMSFFFAFGVTKGSIRLEQNTPVTLPTLAPTPAPPAVTAPPAAPKTQQPPQTAIPKAEETETASVVAADRQPEPPKLVLPAEGEISVPYSNGALIKSKTLGDWRTHNAVDIKASTGSEVKAADDGVVEKAYQDKLMGYTIILVHEGTYQTVYQNLASTEMVKEGDKVTRGQCIAAVGDSAAAEMLEETHLHFALLCDAKPLNPLDYVTP